MIVPSIDISRGRAVQLIGGEEEVIDAGDPLAMLESLSLVGEVAVVDIDAARGEGSNEAIITEMCRMAPIRVGGGVRDRTAAVRWLDAGAAKVIIGTAARRQLLAQLPPERVIVALDSRDGEVVTHGWRRGSGRDLFAALEELSGLCGGFLVTFVEREGRMGGTDVSRARSVVTAAGDAKVTIAGGITTTDEIADLDHLGADAQVGMALYTGRLGLAEAFAAPLVSDRPDGLWPTMVTDERGTALGLAWSDLESLRHAIGTRTGTYMSRTRGLWVKGGTSGNRQELLGVDADCDRDAIRFRVRQEGAGFCHLGTRTCWGEDSGIGRLARRLTEIAVQRPDGSNTVRLLEDPSLLSAKLAEEVEELTLAEDPREVTQELADVIYFALVKAAASGIDLASIESVLDARAARVSRRPMKAKGERS